MIIISFMQGYKSVNYLFIFSCLGLTHDTISKDGYTYLLSCFVKPLSSIKSSSITLLIEQCFSSTYLGLIDGARPGGKISVI